MNSEFENQLQRQPMREIPLQWRARIIAAAQPSPSWWHDWFWPCPQAWAVLGAAWVVIFVFYFMAPDEPRLAGNNYPPQSFAVSQQQAVMMAQLLGSTDADEPPAAMPAGPKPRSECARRELIG